MNPLNLLYLPSYNDGIHEIMLIEVEYLSVLDNKRMMLLGDKERSLAVSPNKVIESKELR